MIELTSFFMRFIRRKSRLALLACLALSGCAQTGWLASRSLVKDGAAEVKASKTADVARPELPVETEVSPRVVAAKSPAAPPVSRESAATRLVAELKERGDLDEKTAEEMEVALQEPDPAVRDLLIHTLLAASRRNDAKRKVERTKPVASKARHAISDEPDDNYERDASEELEDDRAPRRPVKTPLKGQRSVRPPDLEEQPEAHSTRDTVTPVVKSTLDAPVSTPSTPRSTNPGDLQDANASRSPGKAVPSPSATSPPATTPPDTLPWKDSLSRAIDTLEAELAGRSSEGTAVQPPLSTEDRARAEARLRLLYAAADRRQDAAQPIHEQDEHRQAYWKAQLHAISVLLDNKGPPDDDKRAALALRHVREAADHLASASTLDVRNLAFVSRVESYGRFTEFPKAHFHPDQEVLLYVEVDNFAVESKSQGFETLLEGSYQILDAAGQRVADHTFPPEKEICRRPRRDFFIPYRLYMPKSAPPGDYTLQLTIKDVKGDKFGQSSIRFVLEPGPAAAK